MIEKEHAIRILEAMRTNWDEDSKCPNAHALDMAIKSLKSKTYEDAINEYELKLLNVKATHPSEVNGIIELKRKAIEIADELKEKK